jgi:hypothetical protein
VHESAHRAQAVLVSRATAMKSSTKTSMNAAGLERRLCVGRSRGSGLDAMESAVRRHRVVAGQGGVRVRAGQCGAPVLASATAGRHFLALAIVRAGPCGRCPYGLVVVDSSAADGRSVEDRRKITVEGWRHGLTPSVPAVGR